MRASSPRWIRRFFVVVAVLSSGMLMQASCDVTIQFDAIDLLFGTGNNAESPA